MDPLLNWHSAPLTLQTKIDKAYKNTQNVRRFFRVHVGEDFHFTREYMAWMKTNAGKTLEEAIKEYKKQKDK